MRRPLTVLLLSSLVLARVTSLPAQAGAQALGPRLQPTGISQRAETRAEPPADTAAQSRSLPTHAAVQAVDAPDSNATHISNRRLHMVIGGAIGAAVGWMAGRSADGGRAGCGHEQSGLTCDWTSGYEEPAGALLGMLLGIGIGALWPHD